MNTSRRLLCLVLFSSAALLSACASYQPIPEGYSGPTALVIDSIKPRSASLAEVFAAVKVDDHAIANSFGASTGKSQGQGFRLSTDTISRRVPANVPMKLLVRGSHLTGAPIQAMAMQIAGTFESVDAIVEFTPRPDAQYVVKGELKKGGSSVWLEDAETGERLPSKANGK